MSKKIGEIAADSIPKELLTEGRDHWIDVFASRDVELVCMPVSLHPTQAFYLAQLLLQAANEAIRMRANEEPDPPV